MHVASNEGHLDVVEILQAHRASIDVITEVINDDGLYTATFILMHRMDGLL